MDCHTRARIAGDVVVRIDGAATFIVPAPHRTVVTILAEDLSDAVRDGDRVRYDADLRALERTVDAFGFCTDRYCSPDIVLPAAGTDIATARAVVHITPHRDGSRRSWPPVLLFEPGRPYGDTP